MAQVKYHGEYPEDRGFIRQYGHEFSGGDPVTVTDEFALLKFRGNRFFTVVDEVATDDDEASEIRSWLESRGVSVRANASLKALREAKAEYE